MTEKRSILIFDRKLMAEKKYWLQQLSDRLDPVNLPRYSTASGGGVQTVRIAFGELPELEKITRGNPFLTFAAMTAALKSVLFRITGQSQISVGTPARAGAEAENLLAVIDSLNAKQSFKEVLKGVSVTLKAAYEHQRYPWERLIQDLDPDEEAPEVNPLFHISISLENFHGPRPAFTDALHIHFQPDGAAMNVVVTFESGLYAETMLRGFLDQVRNLLRAGLTDLDQAIGSLSLLSEGVWDRFQSDLQSDQAPPLFSQSVPQLVAAHAAATPDKDAVIGADGGLTYGQLHARASRLAGVLRARGVGPETPVALCMRRSPELVVAALAVWEAGGAYLPMDPEVPTTRLAYMVEDAKPALVLVQAYGDPPELPAPTLALNGDGEPVGEVGEPVAASQDFGDLDALAYLIYTSGSTGEPKGSMISHAALLNLLSWHVKAFEVTAEDRATLLAGVAFDASVWELWPYLVSGATVCIPSADTLADTERLSAWMVLQRITIGFAPTPLAEALMTLPWPETCRLRALLTGGDALQRRPPLTLPFKLINNYGLTESAVVTTSGLVDGPQTAGRPTIGKAITNNRLYLLDHLQQPVDAGFPGELYVGGDSLGRGYLGRPSLTAAKYVPDPFAEGFGEGLRLYKTGDLVRRDQQGDIHFLSRIDNQIQLRGYRIELGEIEARLAQHDDVREAVVILREDKGEPQIVGYVTTDQDRLDQDQLDAYLRDVLPDYMVPSRLVLMTDWPLTPNGKIDRKALPAPASAESAGAYVAPRTPGEEIIADIWAEVLGMERVSAQANFFELGGHSLLATQVASRLREIFSVDLSVRRIFEMPTVHGIARYIERFEQGGHEAPPIVAVERGGDDVFDAPASFAQQRLWFLQSLERDGSAYNIAMAFECKGPLDAEKLRDAFGEIVARHEVLRTTFHMNDGELSQRVHPEIVVPLELIDLRDRGEYDRLPAAKEIAGEAAAKAFDLETGPLFQIILMQLSEHRSVLFMVMHHIVSDGWSMGVMTRELIELYESASRGEDPQLATLQTQYVDFSIWQRDLLQGEYLEEQLGYWRKTLADMPPLLELPYKGARPSQLEARGAVTEFIVDPDVAKRLKDVCRGARATLFMGLLASFNILLSRYSRRHDIPVGTPVANRNRLETENLIGFFVNTLVMRTDLSGEPTFRQLLDRVREGALGAYAHQDVPFDRVVDELQPERSLSYTPLFQVYFALQNAPAKSFELPDLSIEPVTFDVTTSKYDLTLVFTETARGLVGNLQYHTDLFSGEQIEAMVTHFQRLLDALSTAPERPVGAHALAADDPDAAAMPVRIEPAPTKPMHEQFEAQVARDPQRIALTCGDETLSYGQLNARANRLAHLLMARGVRLGDRVGLLMTREIDTIVALMAVLKTGAAYVPLDPEAPDDRLAHMLDDAGVALFITAGELEGRLQGRPALVLDALGDELAGQSEDNPGRTVPVSAPIYCLYTSGTTGKPKGTLVGHHQVARLFTSTERWFDPRQDDVWTLFHSLAFDFSVWEMWGALAYGGRLVIVPYWTTRSPRDFYQLIKDEDVSMLSQTPSAFRLLIDSDREADEALDLRWVVFGGEALDFAMLQPWFDKEHPARLANMFGITETTVHVTFHEVTREDALEVSTIGEPIPDLGLYALDAHLNPMPAGVAGELYVAGEGVAQGYLGRPRLTATRFVPDPFAKKEGGRLYRTGDLGRRLDEGFVYEGRIDHQVKIRGFRIELGEIEASLNALAEVDAAVVLTVQTDDEPTQLAAFITAQAPVDSEHLRRVLGQTLPVYMIPAQFHQVDAFPLTLNGKLDRKALMRMARTETQGDYTPPRTSVEEQLADIWSQVLGRDRIGVRDNFFALGGDSIRSIDIVTRAQSFGVQLEPRQVFQHQTIEQLATVVGEAQTAAPPTLPDYTPDAAEAAVFAERGWTVADAYPLTRMQAMMLDAYAAAPSGSGVYHCQHVYRLREADFSKDAFTDALDRLTAEEPMLRTRIFALGGERRQAVLREVASPLTYVDLREQDEATRDAHIRDWIEADRSEPLHEDQLYRYRLFHETDEDFTFALSIHHAVIDGWSHVALLNRLVALYRGFKADTAPVEPVQHRDYHRFVTLEQQRLGDEAAAAWWDQHLRDWTPAPGLTTATTAEGVRTTHHHDIDPDLVARLRQAQRRRGVSFKALLLAAYAQALGDGAVTVGVVANGRTPALIEPLRAVGLFWNMAPLHLSGEGDRLDQAHRGLVDLEAYAGYPLAELLAHKGVDQLFEATFNFVNFHHQETVGHDTLILRENVELDRLHYPLNLAFSLNPVNDRLLLILEHDPTMIAQADARAVVDRTLAALTQLSN